jgi:hypothetical protein
MEVRGFIATMTLLLSAASPIAAPNLAIAIESTGSTKAGG